MFEANQTGELPREAASRGDDFSAVDQEQLFAPGELLLHRFRIVRLIGRGGMGEVYEAGDLELGRVALKTIRSEITVNPALLRRFRQEVQLARRVSHPNICRIHELFALSEHRHAPGAVPGSSIFLAPTLFLTMEFVEGVTLADKLRREGPFRWREAELLIDQICFGLAAIHAAGIVHRDLKTRNIMLVEKNGATRVVLMDFGLALEFSPASGSPGHSQTDAAVVVGTPDSMAPEQFEGRSVSAAADIYALGVVIYEMVTGKRPFAASTPIAAAALRGRKPPPASSLRPGVPGGWDGVIDRCLEYEPADRYSSAAQVIAALRIRDNALGHLGVRIAQIIRRPLGWSIAAAFLAAIGFGIWYWRAQHDYHHPSPEVESWYEKGVSAIREGTYVKATRALQMAEDKDSRFAMVHARLAEAWSELDFTGNADREMLEASALEQQQHLPRLDDMYVHAVRDTLTRDYPGAIREYQFILHALPDSQKADGYVDLGRVNEKAGHIPEALAAYETAARLAPDSPAAFVHIAILQSRLQKKKLADPAFDKAEAIYRTEVNQEGLAQVAYLRGYAADDRGDSAAAKAYLNQSMEIARQISSVQMEISALVQLSDIDSEDGDDQTAAEEANRAIELAREDGLPSLAAIGLARLGATYLAATDPSKLNMAEQPLQEAVRIAEQTQQPLVEAEAILNLASLRDMQKRPDEVVPLARSARDLYKTYGNFTGTLSASMLLARAQSNQGNLSEAFVSSIAVLNLEQNHPNPRDNLLAEDLLGSVLLRLERYPEARQHFQNALKAARTSPEKGFEHLNLADVCWRLGEFSESDWHLSQMPADWDNAQIRVVRADALLTQNKYSAALSAAQRTTEQDSRFAQEHLRLDVALAELHLGKLDAARRTIAIVQEQIALDKDQDLLARMKLLQVAQALAQKSPATAQDLATQASEYFHASDRRESEFISLYYLTMSQDEMGNDRAATATARKAIDIVQGWEQSWSPPLFQSYVHRPDIAAMLLSLRGISAPFRKQSG